MKILHRKCFWLKFRLFIFNKFCYIRQLNLPWIVYFLSVCISLYLSLVCVHFVLVLGRLSHFLSSSLSPGAAQSSREILSETGSLFPFIYLLISRLSVYFHLSISQFLSYIYISTSLCPGLHAEEPEGVSGTAHHQEEEWGERQTWILERHIQGTVCPRSVVHFISYECLSRILWNYILDQND